MWVWGEEGIKRIKKREEKKPNHRDTQLMMRKTTSTCGGSGSRSVPRRLGRWEHFAGCCHRYDDGELRRQSPGCRRCEQNMQSIYFVQF